MNPEAFTASMPGQWAKNLDGNTTFLPNLLPRTGDWLLPLLPLIEESSREMGRLQGALEQEDGLNTGLVLGPLVQREATASSKIEGTVAAEEDLAMFAVAGDEVEKRVPDVRELNNYLRALEWGTTAGAGTRISSSFIRQLHERLMTGVRGGDANPGRFRSKQVLIGGDGSYGRARFVPPASVHLDWLIDDLVDFTANATAFPHLVRAAMAHYQFEVIHPFNDGNGRVGRLLIAVQVVQDFKMDLPGLHMSAYFESDRQAYYDGLLSLSKTGRWADWTEYFLRGVVRQAADTVRRLKSLRKLRREYREKFERARSSVLTSKAIDLLFRQAAITTKSLADHLDITPAAAVSHIKRLEVAGIVERAPGQAYRRVYVAREIFRIARQENP